MRGFALTEWGHPLKEMEKPDPKPIGKEVLVKVRSCGLCHSDLHIQEGHFGGHGGDGPILNMAEHGVTLPLFAGHEIYGEIKDFGPLSGLTEADKGTPVIVFPWTGCQECEACKAGHDEQCSTPRFIGTHHPGGYADTIIVPQAKYCVNAENVSPAQAGVCACAGITALNALHKLGPGKESYIAVIGLGGVGLMVVTVAKALGFKKVMGIDVDDAKLKAAKASGADAVFNSNKAGVVDAIKAEARGGIVGVIDLVGITKTAELGISLLQPPGGVYVVVGLAGGELRMPTVLMAELQYSLHGSHVGTLDDLNEFVGMVKQGKIKPIPATPVPMADINKCLDQLRAGQVTGRLVMTW